MSQGQGSLKILAVVSFIIFLFGGMSVYLAMEMKEAQTENEALKIELKTTQEQLENCK